MVNVASFYPMHGSKHGSRLLSAGCGIALLGFAAASVRCQASPAAAADAASDYAFQGEYAGRTQSSQTGLGVQVVANGNGAFTAVFLPGGLPGAGWDTSARFEQTGVAQAGAVRFGTQGSGAYAATLAADGSSLSGTTPQGEPFTLAKTARQSPTLGAAPPANALVLFDGKDLAAFAKGSATLDSGTLLPQGSAGTGAVTLRSFGSFTLHLEFLVPFMPDHTGQARGNSGVYLQGRYELQILDSFGLNIHRTAGGETQECGAFYQKAAPDLNMSFPPLAWQTYDVEFSEARFDSSGKTQVAPAIVTVRLNGVPIHVNRELTSNTLLGDPIGPSDGPLRFQAHGDPVRFRNIWIVENAGSPIRPALPKKRGAGTGSFRRGSAYPFLVDLNGRSLPVLIAAGAYGSKEGPTAALFLLRE